MESVPVEKPCIECHVVKPLSEYYAHPKMNDGTLGVCKVCHRARMTARRERDPAVQEYDRARSKAPKRRAHLRVTAERWKNSHPDAYRAHYTVSNAIRDGKLTRLPCQKCGTDERVHAHHADYAKPLEVEWLCARCHAKTHVTFHAEGHAPTCR